MTLLTFHATYFEGDDGWVIGIVDELSGALTQGDDLDDARLMLQDVTRIMLRVLHEGPRIKEIVGEHRMVSRELITVDDAEPLALVASSWADGATEDAEDAEFLPLFRFPDHRRFIDDMRAARVPVHVYDGKSYYDKVLYYGPAVTTRDRIALQDVIRATTVRLQWHYVGRYGAMVYPAVNDLELRRRRVKGPAH
ncbi:MAG: hypothetical protein AABO58_00915 [Acidobacteriota bacterium]